MLPVNADQLLLGGCVVLAPVNLSITGVVGNECGLELLELEDDKELLELDFDELELEEELNELLEEELEPASLKEAVIVLNVPVPASVHTG